MIVLLRLLRGIAIVDRGSSGWIAAADLSKILVGVEVTLIESPTMLVIGVGEATIPFLRGFTTWIGFSDDRLWMAESDVTYKTGILFEIRRRFGHQYWHVFEYLDYFDRHTRSGHLWVALHRAGVEESRDARSFYERFMCTMQVNVSAVRGPVAADYAYHVDAGRFAELLKVMSEVRFICDNVAAAMLDEGGGIADLRTRRHGRVRADLHVSCTGFRRLLARSVDTENPLDSYAGSLCCDRAVVLRMPYGDEMQRTEELRPYVRARASDARWIWSIPLNERLSSGYVYSSRHTSDNEALATLRRFLGQLGTAGIAPLQVRFASGKCQGLWTRNCVAIGPASSFVEPLESIGLAITQIGTDILASIFDMRCYDERASARHDMHLGKFYSGFAQFIVARYCITEREDTPFWRAVRNETVIPLSSRHGSRCFGIICLPRPPRGWPRSGCSAT